MRKLAILAVLTACAAVPAAAQTFSGVQVTPGSIVIGGPNYPDCVFFQITVGGVKDTADEFGFSAHLAGLPLMKDMVQNARFLGGVTISFDLGLPAALASSPLAADCPASVWISKLAQ
jgi:hypothetical protein